MIELCTVRRMVATIVFLGIVTIISVVIETKYEPKNNSINDSQSKQSHQVVADDGSDNESFDCSEMMTYSRCKPCASWHQAFTKNECKTGYVMEAKCFNDGLDNPVDKARFVSCEEPYYVKQRTFWAHEGIWLFVGVLSYIFVHFRRSSLDQKVLDRVNKQIASGV